MTKKCPICRGSIKKKKTYPNRSLETVILAVNTDSDYWARLEEDKNWKLSLAIRNTVEPGTQLDVRDTLYVWIKAEVKEVLKPTNGGTTLLFIHYKDWDSFYDEIIPINSSRLAPIGMFSDRTDLPKYLRNNIDLDMAMENGFPDNMEEVAGQGPANRPIEMAGGVNWL